MKNKHLITKITQIGIFSAMAVVLYYFPKFKLPFFPSMLSVQFSMFPTIMGGFMLGPVGGVLICLIKFIFKVIATQTAAVGEIVDLIIGLAVVLTTSLIYKFNHTKKGALIALLMGIVSWVASAVLLNGLWAIPAYSKLYGINAVLGMLKVIPGVNENNYILKYLLFGCLPFNLMLSIVVSLVTFLVYKKVSWLFDIMDEKITKDKQ